MELSEFDIHYLPKTAVKAEALADFIVKCTIPQEEDVAKYQNAPAAPDIVPPTTTDPDPWTIHVDGSSNKLGSIADIVIESPKEIVAEHALRFKFKVSNNVAEYVAVVYDLNIARKAGARKVQVHSDSKLVMSQINGEYKVNEEEMKKHLEFAKRIMGLFEEVVVLQIPLGRTSRADALPKLASSATPDLGRTLYIERLICPSTEEDEVMQVEATYPIIAFLRDNRLPMSKDKDQKIERQSQKYLWDGEKRVM